MKRTLRVLFLAVLAMALMASGAMAKVAPVTEGSFDIKIKAPSYISSDTTINSGDEKTVSLDATSLVITFAKSSKNSSADSYDVKVTIDPAESYVVIKSGDRTLTSGTTKVSGDKKITVSFDVKAAAAAITTSKDFTITFTVFSNDKKGGGAVLSMSVKIKLLSIDSSSEEEGTPGMAFYTDDGTAPFSTIAFALSSDKKTYVASKEITFVVSDEYEITEDDAVKFTAADEDDNEPTWEMASELTDSDDVTGGIFYTYTLTFTANTSDDENVEYTVSEIAIGDLASFEPEDFTITASFSSSGGDEDTDATATISESGDIKVTYFEEKELTIKVSPYRSAGYDIATDFTNKSGATLTSTDMTQGAIHVSATNSKTYTYTAGGKNATDTIVFTVKSGDSEIDEFTVNFIVSLDKSNIQTPPAPTLVTSIPGYELNTLAELETLFKSGKGTARWAVKAAGPVHNRGWILRFKRGNFYKLLEIVWKILTSSSVSIASEVYDEACAIDAVSDDVAVYEVDIENAALGLSGDQTFSVNSSYLLAAYEDAGLTSGDGKNTTNTAADLKVGDITGTQSSGGYLGSSGGCDAGFGALALALAATLFLGKKRS